MGHLVVYEHINALWAFYNTPSTAIYIFFVNTFLETFFLTFFIYLLMLQKATDYCQRTLQE